jgi:hypothetical protein
MGVPGGGRLQDNDGAEHLTFLHAVEGVLDVVKADGLGDEAVKVELAPLIEVDQDREVA